MTANIRRSHQALASPLGDAARRLLGSIRKMAIDRTRHGIWKLLGYEAVAETVNAEVYQEVGFASRPAAGAKAEAIVAMVGGAGAPVVIATRDEGLRKAAGELAEDEAAAFNTLAQLRVTAAGTVEGRSHAGAAGPLATLATMQAFMTVLAAAAPTDASGALTILKAALEAAGWPSAVTSVLLGE